MGIIGWADAPNSIEEEKTPLRNQTLTQLEPAEAPEPLIANAEPIIETADDEVESQEDLSDIGTEELVVPDSTGGNNELTVDDGASESYDGDLVTAIRNLRLKGNPDENRYDISKFELHEIKFLFEHAERIGEIDYFAAVREVFGVKHRILNEKLDIDSIASPNLDELMAFVEEKYEKSYGGDNS